MVRGLRHALRASVLATAVAAMAAVGQGDARPGAAPDTLAADTAAAGVRARPADLKVVRRNYRYRRQVGLALFMMLFVAVALTTSQTFNPE